MNWEQFWHQCGSSGNKKMSGVVRVTEDKKSQALVVTSVGREGGDILGIPGQRQMNPVWLYDPIAEA